MVLSNFDSLILYLIVYSLSAGFLYLSKKYKKNKIDILFLLAVALPVLLAGFRDGVGTDYNSYLNIYKNCSKMSIADWFSTEFYIGGNPFGIWIISRFAGLFDSKFLFFAITSLFVYLPIALTLKKEYSGGTIFLGAFLFLVAVFSNAFNGVKQYIATAIIIFGLKYVYRRKFWAYFFTVLCACLFHFTAVIALLIYFLWSPKNEFFTFKRFCVFIIIFALLIFVPKILESLGGRFEKYTEYEEKISNKIFYLEFAFLLLFIIFSKNLKKIDERNGLLIIIFSVGVILELVGFFSPVLKRIALFYTFAQYLIIAQIPRLADNEETGIMNILIYLYALIYFVYTFYILGLSEIFPYATIFM